MMKYIFQEKLAVMELAPLSLNGLILCRHYFVFLNWCQKRVFLVALPLSFLFYCEGLFLTPWSPVCRFKKKLWSKMWRWREWIFCGVFAFSAVTKQWHKRLPTS